MFNHIYVYIYIYMFIYLYMYTHIFIHIFIYIYIFLSICMYWQLIGNTLCTWSGGEAMARQVMAITGLTSQDLVDLARSAFAAVGGTASATVSAARAAALGVLCLDGTTGDGREKILVGMYPHSPPSQCIAGVIPDRDFSWRGVPGLRPHGVCGVCDQGGRVYCTSSWRVWTPRPRKSWPLRERRTPDGAVRQLLDLVTPILPPSRRLWWDTAHGKHTRTGTTSPWKDPAHQRDLPQRKNVSRRATKKWEVAWPHGLWAGTICG